MDEERSYEEIAFEMFETEYQKMFRLFRDELFKLLKDPKADMGDVTKFLLERLAMVSADLNLLKRTISSTQSDKGPETFRRKNPNFGSNPPPNVDGYS